MGMTCSLHRVAAPDVARLRESPSAVEDVLFPPGSTPPVVEVREKGIAGWLLRMVGVQVTQVDPNWVPPGQPEPPHDRIDLDKAWHGLHYIFTRTPWEGEPPGCFLVVGGEEIGDEDDENRARMLDPDQVRQFSTFLGSISDDEFASRFDAERMTALEIYPPIWTREHEQPPALEYLRDEFRDLRQFVSAAAEQGDAIVVALN